MPSKSMSMRFRTEKPWWLRESWSISKRPEFIPEIAACSLPPYTLDKPIVRDIERQMRVLALELGVVGLTNAQFAVKDRTIYVLEVNPRGSRTVPFVSKAIGVPLAKLAMKVMMGQTLKKLGFTDAPLPAHFSVKEAVFPFNKFPGIDALWGPK